MYAYAPSRAHSYLPRADGVCNYTSPWVHVSCAEDYDCVTGTRCVGGECMASSRESFDEFRMPTECDDDVDGYEPLLYLYP